MSRAVVSLLLLAAVVGCQSGPPPARTAPVYEVVSHGLTTDEAERLREVFKFDQLALGEAGVARWADETSYLALPMKPVEATEAKSEDEGEIVFEGFDFDAIRQIETLALDDAAARVAEGLALAGLMPGGARARSSHTRFQAVTAGGETLADQAVDTTVSYTFTLDGRPLEGPGAKVRVAFDGDGEVVHFHHSLLGVERAGEVRVLDDAAARDRCAAWTTSGDGGGRRITAATLAYYAPPLADKPARLEPSFRCHSLHDNGAVGQITFVPAAVDAARPALEVARQERSPDAEPPDVAAAPAPAAIPGRVDVGSEGTGPCSGLPNTALNVASFNNRMSAGGVTVQFSWLDAAAWERDWKDPSHGGRDHIWVDNVDMAYWQGHGWPEGFSFSGCSSIDDTSMTNADALWGNRDAEWISLFTCLVLKAESGGQRWWQRWGGAFDRLHQINSFDTVSYHSSQHGGIYAGYLLGSPFPWWQQPMKVRQAWAQASIDDQPPQVVWATMGAFGSGGLSNYNDYFWGRGSVGPDIPAGQITGYWWVAGGS